jgi:DTW domain-containing protein
LNRRRKTVGRCPDCHFFRPFCICNAITRIELSTKVCLVVHAKELRRSTNTGRLAVRALINSEMRIRGQGTETLDLADLLTSSYRSFLLYPSTDAVELNNELLARERAPIQLIVPDGSWRQASKVHYRHRELKDVQRVMIKAPDRSKFSLRRQHREEGMATLQAIAHALGIIEGDLVKDQLLRLYYAIVRETLRGRGASVSQTRELMSIAEPI